MMNQISKVLVTISLISAAFAAVAGTEQESAMRHDHTVGDGHQVMLDLLKRGEVVSVAPMNKERSDNKAINNTLKGNVRPYEIKIRTPDGRLHAVEFRGMPAKINNRSHGNK